jgi:hypothetical protein
MEETIIEKICEIIEQKKIMSPGEYLEAKESYINYILADKQLTIELYQLHHKLHTAELEIMQFVNSAHQKMIKELEDES